MKCSLLRIAITVTAGAIAIAVSPVRLIASPPQVPAETIRVAPRSDDHKAPPRDAASALARATAMAADSGMMIAMAVPSRLVEYTIRRRRGVGRFITDSVLKAESGLTLDTVLRLHLLGIGRLLDARRRSIMSIDDRCTLDVIIDGVRATGDIDDIRPGALAGVEFYDRFTSPAQYRRASAPCEMLLLWTR
jgi:hypothetical protein